MVDAYQDSDTGMVSLVGRVLLPRLGIGNFVLFAIDERAESTVLTSSDVLSLDVPWRDCPVRDVPVVLDDQVLECRETDAIIVFEGDGFERWGYRTRIAILPPDAAPGMLSRLGRDIRRRLHIETDAADSVSITPLSWDFAGD